MTAQSQIGRLAMRVEGDNWTAYYAPPNTMDGAIYLGQIKAAFVQKDKLARAFIALMKEAASDIIEEKTGVRPTWPNPPIPAPENERSGRA